MMSEEKAAKLAAIRAKNAANKAQSHQPAQSVAQAQTTQTTQTTTSADTQATSTSPSPATVAQTSSGMEEELSPAMALQSLLLILLAVIVGTFAAIVVLPAWIPGLSASLLGPEPKAYWYLARASGFVAYGLLWFSMVMGLLMTGKLARLWPGGPTAIDLHQHVSLLGLGFGLFHGLILLGDRYIGYTLTQILLPFASTHQTMAVGIGQVSFSLMLLVTLSFYARRFIGRKVWKLLHMLSFAAFLMALAHGISSGTDTGTIWAQLIYWVSGGSVLFLTIYRVLVSLPAHQPQPKTASSS